MELRHLRYFVAVAQDLSFTKAAEKLRVAQPALSRQIKQLEDELGVTLFERNRRGVILTSSGGAFLEQANALLRQSEAAVLAAKNADGRRVAPLNIGYVWGLFHSTAPMLIERFRRQCPDCVINLLDMSATQQAKALTAGEVDLGFIGFALEADGARLDKRKVGGCEFVAALPLGHSAARRKQVDLASLASELFLVISEQSYPGAAKLIVNACRNAGFAPKVVQTPERGHTILSLVASGCGIALLPEPLSALPHSGVVFKRLSSPVSAELYVAWNGRRKSALRDQFMKQIGS